MVQRPKTCTTKANNTMFKKRLYYFFAMVLTIVAGLLSRHYLFVPLFWGDVLWATMVYWGVCFCWPKAKPLVVYLGSLGFCAMVEFSQLYQVPWLNAVRHTTLGHLILGETFYWADLLSYLAGVSLGWALRSLLVKLYAN
jgi:hypothetical protein